MKCLPAVEHHPLDFVAGEPGYVHRDTGGHSGQQERAAAHVGDKDSSCAEGVLHGSLVETSLPEEPRLLISDDRVNGNPVADTAGQNVAVEVPEVRIGRSHLGQKFLRDSIYVAQPVVPGEFVDVQQGRA